MRTLMIILALSFLTRDKGAPLISSRALTCGCTACGDTVSIWSTRVGVAGVRLLLAPCDGVGHRDISCYTLAHRVTKAVDIAVCVRTTRSRITWVWSGNTLIVLTDI